MSGNVASLISRRLDRKPDIVMTANIRGVLMPGGWMEYQVVIDGEDDPDRAATILRAAAAIITDPESVDLF